MRLTPLTLNYPITPKLKLHHTKSITLTITYSLPSVSYQNFSFNLQQKNKKIEMLKQPSTNVKQTNVAYIRYRINNKMFEIVCYRNKAVNWRNGLEEDLSQVLQIEEVYENASHGTLIKKSDLNKFFPNKSKKQILEVILERGELQVSDKEREVHMSGIMADVVKIIVEKCVHPTTKRRFTTKTIESAVKDIHFPVKHDQPAKRQALACIKLLQKQYKIARGEMKIKISFDKETEPLLTQTFKKLQIDQFEKEEEKGDRVFRVYNIEPKLYHQLTPLCKKMGNVAVEVVVGILVNEENKELETEEFSALELLDDNKEKNEDEEEEKKEVTKPQLKPKVEGKSEEKVMKCTTCGQTAIFGTAHEQRQHFKVDWHVENVKRKSKHLPPLSEEEFKVDVFNKDFV